MMRSSILVMVCMAAFQSVLVGQVEPTEPPDEQAEQKDRWERNQPAINTIIRWNDKVIVEADRYYEIDTVRLKAIPLELENGAKIEALATYQGKKPLVLCTVSDRRKILHVDGKKNHEITIPSEVATWKKPPMLAADESSIVLVASLKCFQYRDDKWKSISVDPLKTTAKQPYERSGSDVLPPDHTLLAGNIFYAGYSHGEFGGGLWSLDLTNGKRTWVSDEWAAGKVDDPVTSIARGPRDEIWISQGLAHLGVSEGFLRTKKDEKWQSFAKADYEKQKSVNWSHEATDFNTVAFDSRERLHLLTGSLGVLRYENGKWHRLTPDWPWYVYLQGMVILPDGRAVIATFDSGVLLCDFEKDSIQRIVLKD